MTVDLSRPKILNHLIKGTVFGVAGHRLALFAMTCEQPWNYLLGVVVWLLAAACLRNVHALLVFPRLELTPDEMRLRYWKPTPFLSAAMVLPFNRVVDVTIPWSKYLGCQTRKISGGDPWDAWEGLYIETTSTFHEIGWDVFARSVDQLMTEINAFREARFRAPVKEGVDIPAFNALRFANPLRLVWAATPAGAFAIGCGVLLAVFLVPLMFVFFGAIGAVVVLVSTFAIPFVLRSLGAEGWAEQFENLHLMEDTTIPLLGGKAPLAVQIGVVGGMLTLIGVAIWFWLGERAMGRTRVIELRTDGLALGRQSDELRVIPWEDVIRAEVMTSTNRTHKDGSVYEFTTERVEVHVRGGSPIVLTHDYGRGFAALGELIDPPPLKVAVARGLMARGMDVEAAAVAAGLPAANP
jgi:hypothetical protein